MVLEIINQSVDISNISKSFGLDVNSFLILILGSFIVGYTCLTFFYKIYYVKDNQDWTKLEFSEKAIVSFFIGFLTILASVIIVSIWQLMNINNKNLEQLFSQLNYVFPFFYFGLITAYLTRENYNGLDFIKRYIWISIYMIIILSLLFTLVILILFVNWLAALVEIVIVVLYIIAWKIIKKHNPFKKTCQYLI